MIDLPSSKLYSVIKKNLATSQALIYVRQVSRTDTRACPTCPTRVMFQFNATTAEEELRLGCGDRDLAQWREREAGIAGVSFSQMVRICSGESTGCPVILGLHFYSIFEPKLK